MSTRSSFFYVALIALVMVALSACESSASGPMPYTKEALSKLNDSMAKIKAPGDLPGSNDQKVKETISTYKRIFLAAGYDYEQSMIKIISDIKENRYVVNRATVTLNKLARELLELHVKNGINPRKYLSKECAELVIDYRDIVRKNMEKTGSC